ncbi:MAG: hypothetical protein JW994_03975, partial [Candidatus Omnitrophica bacterium]|nr:hypothetical protein [Candidatus Omnitrophota bacterium]
MGIVQAIKKGFTLSGKFMNVIFIFFVFNAVMGLISLPITKPENVGNPSIAGISLILSVIFFVVFIFLQGATLGLVRDVHKTGSFNISNFVPYGKKYYVKILGLLLISILIAAVLVLILGLLGSGVITLFNNNFTKILVGV